MNRRLLLLWVAVLGLVSPARVQAAESAPAANWEPAAKSVRAKHRRLKRTERFDCMPLFLSICAAE